MAWPVESSLALEPGVSPWPVDLAAVLSTRRSRRTFDAVPLSTLGALLWQTSRTLAVAPSPYGFELQQRPTPSAGAIHPIHLVLQVPGTKAWARYNTRTHRLDLLGSAGQVLDGLLGHVAGLIDPGAGSIITFVAEPGLTATKYDHPAALFWRDAGVLQGTLAVVAEALSTSFCLLGATGNPWVGELADKGKLIGTGLAVLGASSKRC